MRITQLGGFRGYHDGTHLRLEHSAERMNRVFEDAAVRGWKPTNPPRRPVGAPPSTFTKPTAKSWSGRTPWRRPKGHRASAENNVLTKGTDDSKETNQETIIVLNALRRV